MRGPTHGRNSQKAVHMHNADKCMCIAFGEYGEPGSRHFNGGFRFAIQLDSKF